MIIQETKDYIVINKPSGIECEHELPELIGQKLYCVHRLDKPTQGLIVYAKTKEYAAKLSRIIQNQEMEKYYYAVISGIPEEKGILEDYLYKDTKRHKMYPVKKKRKGVKFASLDYIRLGIYDETSLVKVHLHTGRMHQIRVQFASRKMPILGDKTYGSKINTSLALICTDLYFDDMHFHINLPDTYPWYNYKL